MRSGVNSHKYVPPHRPTRSGDLTCDLLVCQVMCYPLPTTFTFCFISILEPWPAPEIHCFPFLLYYLESAHGICSDGVPTSKQTGAFCIQRSSPQHRSAVPRGNGPNKDLITYCVSASAPDDRFHVGERGEKGGWRREREL